MEAMSDSEDDLRKLQVTLYTKLVITCIIEHYVALKEVESKKSPLNNINPNQEMMVATV